MKSAVAAVGLFAAFTDAFGHRPYQPRHLHWRRDNSTATTTVAADTAGTAAPLTTLTVEVTSVQTITSCAPTITDCPLSSGGGPVVITNTIVLTEVVCPITDVDSITSSIIKEHETGGLPGSTRTGTPIVTATSSALGEAASSGIPGSGNPDDGEEDDEGDDEGDDDEDCPADEPGAPGSEGPGSPPADELTTTTTIQTTQTRTVTVPKPTPTGPGGESGDSSSPPSPGSPGGPGSEGECQCPSAATVTLPASTVYVTLGGPTPSATDGSLGGGSNPLPEEPLPTKTVPDATNNPIVTPAPEDDEDDEDEDDEEEACDPETQSTVTLETTVIVPFPTNGTSSGGAQPTGAPLRRSHFGLRRSAPVRL